MSDFRDAVKRVQADAARSDWSALEAVLHDTHAERAARLVAANLLARAGGEGTQILMAALMFGDDRTKATTLQAYLRAQTILDEALVLEATHSKSALVRRSVRRLLKQLPYPISETFRLRCYLPTPYYNVARPDEELADWIGAPGTAWYGIVQAIATIRYLPAIPTLIQDMTNQYHGYFLPGMIARYGKEALPFLLDALPESDDTQRDGILRTLRFIGGPEADAAQRTYDARPAPLPLRAAAPTTPAAATPSPPTTPRPLPGQLPAEPEVLIIAAQVPVVPPPLPSLRRTLTAIWKRLRGS